MRERPPEVVSPLTLALTTDALILSAANCFSSRATQPDPRGRPYSALNESPSTRMTADLAALGAARAVVWAPMPGA